MKEKKRELFIKKYGITNGIAYSLIYNKKGTAYSLIYNKENNSKYFLPIDANFYDVLNTLINVSDSFYKTGIKLKFEKNPIIEIPEREKKTIEKLVNRLENLCIENRNLKNSLKIVSESSKDKTHFSNKYKIKK